MPRLSCNYRQEAPDTTQIKVQLTGGEIYFSVFISNSDVIKDVTIYSKAIQEPIIAGFGFRTV